ncbi:MAG: DUF4249 domain-containing protein [Rhodothermales bacterium]
MKRPTLSIRFATLAAAVALLAGCESVVDIDLPAYDPQLVVIGSFSPGGPWDVQVTHSVAVLDSALIEPIADATVEIWQGDTRLALLPHTPRYVALFQTSFAGYYIADAPSPQVGVPYTLRVSAPGYASVEAISAVPAPVAIASHTFQDSVLFDQNGPEASIGEMRIRLVDPGDARTYYRLRVQVETADGAGFFPAQFDVNQDIRSAYGRDANLGFGSDQYVLPLTERIVFDDAFFDGQTYELQVRFFTTDLFGLSFAGDEGSRSPGFVRLLVDTITEADYRAERSRDLQDQQRDNPFSEPVPIFTNVRDGLGLFAGFHTVFDERLELTPFSFDREFGRADSHP